MKRSGAFSVSFFLLVLVFVPGIARGQQQDNSPTITIIQPKASPVTVSFTARELQQVDTNPQFVLTKLGALTARDCAYPRRISSCIWACSSGRKMRTCNAVLVRALERLWPK